MLDAADPRDPDNLLDEALSGDLARVQALVSAGANLEAKGLIRGTTSLHHASERGHINVVQYLIECGADKEARTSSRSTPLFDAVSAGQLSVVQLLVDHGANKEAANNIGLTPLIIASMKAYLTIAEYLLDNGCDRDNTGLNEKGFTALHHATNCGHLEIALLLMRYGARIDIRDNGGFLPAENAVLLNRHAIGDAIRAEEIRRHDHGFKRDRSTISGTEEYEAARRPRVELVVEAADESDDDDDDDDDDDEGEGK